MAQSGLRLEMAWIGGAVAGRTSKTLKLVSQLEMEYCRILQISRASFHWGQTWSNIKRTVKKRNYTQSPTNDNGKSLSGL